MNKIPAYILATTLITACDNQELTTQHPNPCAEPEKITGTYNFEVSGRHRISGQGENQFINIQLDKNGKVYCGSFSADYAKTKKQGEKWVKEISDTILNGTGTITIRGNIVQDNNILIEEIFRK